MMQDQQPDMESSSDETGRYDYRYAPMIPTNQFQSEKINLLAEALAKAQGVIVAPPRSRTVRVVPRTGGAGYTFKYATLSDIIDAVQKPLSDNGIARLQLVSHDSNGGFYKLTTYLMHSSGQFIACEVPIITEGHSNQQFGSALTYMKRYTLSAMVGLSAPEEVDESKAHDWLKFGQKYVATARGLSSMKDLQALKKLNEMPLKNMEIHAKKLFANMMVAMLQIEKDLSNDG